MDGELNKQLQDPEFRIKFERASTLMRAADLIDDLLTAQDVSQKQLADRLKVSPAHVSQLLAGDRNMTLATLSDAVWALGGRVVMDFEPLETFEWKTASHESHEWHGGPVAVGDLRNAA